MFAELAKIPLFQPRRAAPARRATMHSNDNLPGFRRPVGGQRPRPNLALACHWYLVDGRLECRWRNATPDGAPIKARETQSAAERVSNPSLRWPDRDNLKLGAAG